MQQAGLAQSETTGAKHSVRATTRARPVVLHVLEAFAGGTERHLRDLVRHIDRFDHVVAVPSRHHATSTATAAERLQHLGAQIRQIEMGRSHSAHDHVLALAALRRLLRSLSPDIVHGHSSVGGALARVATVGSGVPVVYTPHGFSRSSWTICVERLLSGRADTVIAVSPSERKFAEAHRLAVLDRTVVIPNGIDPDSPPPLAEPLRARWGLGPEVPLVGSVGRLAWQKAPEVFVAACATVFQSVPEAHFVLIASGPMQQQVERAVKGSGIDRRFHLIPHLPDAAPAIEEFDVFALSSRFEGAPYTPIEAMRSCTAVILTDVAGNNDLVEDGVTGLLVPPDEPHLLADGILRLLQDVTLRQNLTAAARERVMSYGVQAMAAETARVYEGLLVGAAQRTGRRLHPPPRCAG